MNQAGIAKIGIDDFAKKLIGRVYSVELPNLGMKIKSRTTTVYNQTGKQKHYI